MTSTAASVSSSVSLLTRVAMFADSFFVAFTIRTPSERINSSAPVVPGRACVRTSPVAASSTDTGEPRKRSVAYTRSPSATTRRGIVW